MIHFLIKKAVTVRNFLVYKKYAMQAGFTNKPFPLDPTASFVISVASYPKRIHLLPSVFQALTRQTVSPRHAYIVLAEEEFPNQKVPKFIEKLVRRGVEIVWTKKNPYAVKVIIPILLKHPDLRIIPLDDDLIYGIKVFELLIKKSQDKKNCIVGHVGKILYRRGNVVGMMFRESLPATVFTPSERIYFLKGSGTLYTPGSLDPRVTDIDAINKIVPGRGADLWLWAAAIAADTKQICLGTPLNRELYIPIPLRKKTLPRDIPGKDVMEQRFQMAIDYFGIREKLIESLPDKDA